MSVQIIRGDARTLPLADNTVDLIVTSPPYFGLRSYQDGGEHYAGQLGDEATPAEFVDALIACTAEWMRVLKPSGSMWVNLGDKYDSGTSTPRVNGGDRMKDGRERESWNTGPQRVTMGRPKSLIGIPWRYALRCIDDLGLILRAEVIWSKPNGLPESVTDRVRRSHEQWFHFTMQPRYFSAVDEIREAHAEGTHQRRLDGQPSPKQAAGLANGTRRGYMPETYTNPLGKLPGSVWTVPTEPLRVPESLGIDHFAAFPTEWPRRIIQGWSPSGVCDGCGEGRRPVVAGENVVRATRSAESRAFAAEGAAQGRSGFTRDVRWMGERQTTITGYTCACHEPTAATTPAIVLDPFSGTGTTVMVAHALGRHGIGVDMSADYCRLAEWRTSDPAQLAKVRGERKPIQQIEGQEGLWSA